MQPNGIVGTPDGKKLYVADIGDKKTYVYSIAKDGTLTDRQLFCEMGSDGMTIDCEGNVYLTGRGVTVFNKAGEKIQEIGVEEGWTANVCFGGKDRKTLFITASTGFYGIRTGSRGKLNAECGMRNAECGMWNVECGMRIFRLAYWKIFLFVELIFFN